MEARLFRAIVLMAALSAFGASARTPNFIVTASSPQLAEEVARAAENYRRELAISWLGQELRPWQQPCPIVVKSAPNLGAGGVTKFVFDNNDVYGWDMSVQGTRERILDSVLPHEITHTIFASHFRQAVPRWADEGGCTTVEHSSERDKQQRMLIEFLTTNRGIPFSKMFAMKDYPHDILPLYSQGYSLARMLIAQGGRRKFIEFLGDGMKDKNWPKAVAKHYGHKDLGVLQDQWVAWVRQGSPINDAPAPADTGKTILASNQTSKRERPEPNLIYRSQNDGVAPQPYTGVSGITPIDETEEPNWRSEEPRAKRGRVSRDPFARAQSPEPATPEKGRQVILEWSRADTGTVLR